VAVVLSVAAAAGQGAGFAGAAVLAMGAAVLTLRAAGRRAYESS